MFQLLKNPSFDFMGKRHILVSLSGILVVASVVILVTHGLNLGIEFTGGTELQVRYVQAPNLGRIRSALRKAGMANAVVTTLGPAEDHEVYIRLSTGAKGGKEEDLAPVVADALRPADVAEKRNSGLTDLNVVDESRLADLLRTAPGLDENAAKRLAETILTRRKETAVFHSMEELTGIAGMTPEVRSFLAERAFLGPFAIRGQNYIGPSIGRELLNKAMFAILGSLAGMLIYIAIRFQFQWGLAAVVALAHDTVITLGLFSLFGREMSLPVVAAFLTLIGYSVNDSVVVFDRIRENLRLRAATGLENVINVSINQTLSRTVITSGLTWIVVLALFIFGGEALNPFAFVLTIGIVVGTYSSIYIASPILVLWRQFVRRRADHGARGKAPVGKKARKKKRASSSR